MFRTLALTALVLAAPLSLAAQQPDAATRIEAAKQNAAERGIPVSLLESKIREGQAKGVSMDRIATAVESRLSGLSRAREALSRTPGQVGATDLLVGAEALDAGVGEAVLVEISARAQGKSRAVAIATLTELVRHGQAPEEALLRVQEALARGPEALQNLPAQAAKNARRGPPAHAGPSNGVGRAGAGHGGPPVAVPRGRPGEASGGKPGGKPGGRPGGN